MKRYLEAFSSVVGQDGNPTLYQWQILDTDNSCAIVASGTREDMVAKCAELNVESTEVVA